VSNLLVRNIHTLVTSVPGEDPAHEVDVLVSDGTITAVGRGLKEPTGQDDNVIDASGCVVYPGFINTHHHLFQALTRNVPAMQNAKLFTWLKALYEIWRGLTPEGIEVSAQVGIGELMLSGCTTTTDHLYLFPSGTTRDLVDIEIEAARRMGIRFHPTRGSMSLGKSNGGLPPDDIVQSSAEILADCERVIDAYHDPGPFSMCRIALAPCSPFSVTPDLMKETADLARDRNVLLHTHLCETIDEEKYCLKHHGVRPLEFMVQNDWVGEDTWYAHGIYFNDDEVRTLAETGTGIAHCPGSNLRLGSGTCRVPYLLEQGVRVGLAVDGSASNDASNMVREMQLALLVHRVDTGVDAMPAERVLGLATTGGASILRWPEIGRVAEGCAADLAMFRLDRIEFAGAMHDPASALLFCGSGARAEYTIVNGKIRVAEGRLVDIDEERLVRRANEIAAELVAGG